MQEETGRGRKPMDTPSLLGCVHVLIRSLCAVYMAIGRLARVSTGFWSTGSTQLSNTRQKSVCWTWLDLPLVTTGLIIACLHLTWVVEFHFLSNTFHIWCNQFYYECWFCRLRTGNVLFNYKQCEKTLRSEGFPSLPPYTVLFLCSQFRCHLFASCISHLS